MKPAPFQYVRASSIDDALAGLAGHRDDAKVLAGGQSLIALMNLRLVRPAVLVDINRLVRDRLHTPGEWHAGDRGADSAVGRRVVRCDRPAVPAHGGGDPLRRAPAHPQSRDGRWEPGACRSELRASRSG